MNETITTNQIKRIEDQLKDPSVNQLFFELFPHGLVAVDLETTGLSPLVHEVIEIGAIKITPSSALSSQEGKYTPFLIEVFKQLICPRGDIEAENSLIHGIDNDMVKDMPTIVQVLPDFTKFIGSLPLIGHNFVIDVGFLTMEAYKNQVEFKADNMLLDSCALARYTLSKQHLGDDHTHLQDYKLSSLCEYFSYDLNAHRALPDAIACLFVTIQTLKFHSTFAPTLSDTLNTKAYLFRWSELSVDSMVAEVPKVLEQCLNSGNSLKIVYTGGSLGRDPRPVKPIALIPMPKGLVLYAECLMSGYNKSFKLNKIANYFPI